MQQIKKEKPVQSLAFECFGVKIGIQINIKGILDKIRSTFPAHSKEIEFSEAHHIYSIQIISSQKKILFFDEDRIEFNDLKTLLSVLRAKMRQCVAACTPERVFIHAGVVEWKGDLILLPGRGLAGKTTLTAELVKAGATYYSDEFAILDADGFVYPYPKPLSMRRRNSTDTSQTDYDVEHFGGTQGYAPMPVKLVVLTEYKPKARWQPEVLSPGQGIIEILKHTNSSLKNPEMAIKVLKKVALQAKIIKSKRGDAQKAAFAVLSECYYKK